MNTSLARIGLTCFQALVVMISSMDSKATILSSEETEQTEFLAMLVTIPFICRMKTTRVLEEVEITHQVVQATTRSMETM